MPITREAFPCTLVLLLVHLKCSLGDQPRNKACRGDNRDEFGFALLGHHYAVFSVDTFGRCFSLCFEERCQSVTYLWDLKGCQLNKETKNSKPADFVRHPAASYMENPFRGKFFRCTGINTSEREECGWGGISAEDCEEKGCCFDDSI